MSFDMYQENILDHYKHPYHRGALENPTLDYRDLNPLCGDEVRVQARVDQNGCLVEAYFDGAGCVISLAAASMLMEEAEGKTLAEIKAMERQDMLDLLGIPLTTMRVKCAMLALRTLEKSIHLYESAATDPRREPCPLGRCQRLTYTRR
jgi:nitrogen fixation NifU-like protein